MAAEALGLRGKVVTPSFTFIATAQALEWANLRPVFCDVDPATHHVTPATIEGHLDGDVSAILAVNLWAAVAISLSFRRWPTNAGCDYSTIPRMRSAAK